MTPLRIYTDTSVIGGCLDAEFAEHSLRFIDQVIAGRVMLLVSELLVHELANAPQAVHAILDSLPLEQLENIVIDEEIDSLRDAYIAAGILSSRWQDDATHVAAASVAGADAIVSWNFRHIVRLDLMRRYNEVNAKRGYQRLAILTSLEVVYGLLEEDASDF